MDALMDKNAFMGLNRCTWLFTGAESPPLKEALNAVTDYFEHRSRGPDGRDHNAYIEQSCKSNVAKLMNSKVEQIAFTSNSSESISMIANSLDWQPGDNVVINTLEFPSGVLPWLLMKNQGIEVRVVHHRDWQVSVEDVLNQVDHRTRIVVTSHVSYQTGSRFDYKKLYDQLKQTRTLLLLDVTQSLGAIEVDSGYADYVVCSSYKWLLSTHGVGILSVNLDRISGMEPKYVGWRSVQDMFSSTRFESFQFQKDARKFELGYPSFPTLYSLNYSSGLLATIGAANIERHILSLGSMLIAELKKLGYEVMTPENPALRAGNISFLCPGGESVAERLRKDSVYLWGGDGRIRASVHLFNDSQDIAELISRLPQAILSS